MSRQRQRPGAKVAPPAVQRKLSAILESPVIAGIAALDPSPDEGAVITYSGGNYSWENPVV